MIILVVEDHSKTALNLQKGLERERFTVELCDNGKDALEKATINDYDVILMDIMIPEIDGLTVCQKLRDENIKTPIIMLTAKDTIEDRIHGLNIGATDYVVKPFSFDELVARIKRIIRDSPVIQYTKLQVGDLILDPGSYEVFRGDKEIHLSDKEYRLLEYMMRHKGKLCTRTMIGEHIWGFDFYPKNSNIIDSFISYLRKKIDGGFPNKLIHTVRNVGYKIKDKSQPVLEEAKKKQL